jgi:hypothetical protein
VGEATHAVQAPPDGLRHLEKRDRRVVRAVLAVVAVVTLAAGTALATGTGDRARTVDVTATGDDEPAQIVEARAILSARVTGDVARIRKNFDQRMLAALSEATLRDNWAQMLAIVGTYEGVDGQVTLRRAGDYFTVEIPLRFSRGLGRLRVSFDAEGKVAGLYILRRGTPASGPEVDFARSIANDLRDGRFAAVADMVAAPFRRYLPEEELRAAWQEVIAANGKLRGTGPATSFSDPGHTTVEIPLEFERGSALLLVTMTSGNAILGVSVNSHEVVGLLIQ